MCNSWPFVYQLFYVVPLVLLSLENLGKCTSTTVKPPWTTRNSIFVAAAPTFCISAWQNRQQACPLPAGMVSLVSGEVEHIVHLIRWNLNSCLCACSWIWLRSLFGNNARLSKVEMGPLSLIVLGVLPSSPTSPPSDPNSSPVPLCNVLWGLGVCPVLVRSVSPCRLVLEVRLFPSPLRCFGLLPVVCVHFFLPVAFQGCPGSGRVCLCVTSK